MRPAALALLAALCAFPARGQQADEVRRGTIDQVVRVAGTVETAGSAPVVARGSLAAGPQVGMIARG